MKKGMNSQPKKRTRNRKSKSTHERASQSGASGIEAGYSTSMKQTILWSGRPTKAMNLRIAIYEIGTAPLTTDGLRGILGAAQQSVSVRLGLTGQSGYNAAGNAVQNEFVSPALDLEASSFTRFRVSKLAFEYCPQSGTNTTQRMVFAYANDPAHPLLNNAGVAQTQARLEAVSDSIPFAPWKAWRMDVTKALDKNQWLYCSDTLAGSALQPDAIDRFNTLGCIACQSSGGGTAVTGDVFGVLYMNIDLEFKEFCPISVTRPSLLRSLAEKCIRHAAIQDGGSVKGSNSLMLDDANEASDCFPSLPNPSVPPMLTREFINEFQRLRKLGLAPNECLTIIQSEHPNLSAEICSIIQNVFGDTVAAEQCNPVSAKSYGDNTQFPPVISSTSLVTIAKGELKGREK